MNTAETAAPTRTTQTMSIPATSTPKATPVVTRREGSQGTSVANRTVVVASRPTNEAESPATKASKRRQARSRLTWGATPTRIRNDGRKMAIVATAAPGIRRPLARRRSRSGSPARV